MGSAVARGLLEAKSAEASDLIIATPHPDRVAELARQGVAVTSSDVDAVKGADLVVVAVKPWVVAEVVALIADHIDKGTEVCFILAGMRSDELVGLFSGSEPCTLSIAMPNTAMSVRRSMTFMVPIRGEPVRAREVFEALGSVMTIQERLLPAATALASCGIAYALRYVRAATEGGVELGFKATEAQEIVSRTMAGAVALLAQPGAHAESEIDKVTTPGGLTIRGLNAMERAGFSAAVAEGLKASVK